MAYLRMPMPSRHAGAPAFSYAVPRCRALLIIQAMHSLYRSGMGPNGFTAQADLLYFFVPTS